MRSSLLTHRVTGDYIRDGIRALMPRHSLIGDVRGKGLLLLSSWCATMKLWNLQATETERLLDLMRNNGVLISNEGFNDNVLKIRPPMAFRSKHADILIEALNKLFAAF